MWLSSSDSLVVTNLLLHVQMLLEIYGACVCDSLRAESYMYEMDVFLFS